MSQRPPLVGWLPSQPSSDGVDQVGREMGQVSERLMLDLAAFSVGSSQEMGLIDLPFVGATRGGYMYCTVSAWHTYAINDQIELSSSYPQFRGYKYAKPKSP